MVSLQKIKVPGHGPGTYTKLQSNYLRLNNLIIASKNFISIKILKDKNFENHKEGFFETSKIMSKTSKSKKKLSFNIEEELNFNFIWCDRICTYNHGNHIFHYLKFTHHTHMEYIILSVNIYHLINLIIQ